MFSDYIVFASKEINGKNYCEIQASVNSIKKTKSVPLGSLFFEERKEKINVKKLVLLNAMVKAFSDIDFGDLGPYRQKLKELDKIPENVKNIVDEIIVDPAKLNEISFVADETEIAAIYKIYQSFTALAGQMLGFFGKSAFEDALNSSLRENNLAPDTFKQ
jgi:hypothetical protein